MPRHIEIGEALARKICRGLSVPPAQANFVGASWVKIWNNEFTARSEVLAANGQGHTPKETTQDLAAAEELVLDNSRADSFMNSQINQDGFAMIPHVIGAVEQETLLSSLGSFSGAGRRGLLGLPTVAALARAPQLRDLIRPHLLSDPFPVRAIYFDKTPEANWLVSWHQDLTIALRARAEVAGFGPWSTKEGIPHVQPPVECLQQMLTVRLHLDNADGSNGALRVLPGSHRLGRLSAENIRELRTRQTDHLCAAAAGDALVMRPLLLHASGRSTSTRHRRVLHIEYAAFALPPELCWHEAA